MTQINLFKTTTLLVLTSTMWLGGCSSYPVARGVHNNQVATCPSSPNCITSNKEDEDHLYPAIRYTGTPQQAKEKLLAVLNEYPRCTITQDKDNYVRAEFTTAIMRFTDDTEFLILDNKIQVRSASRVGYSDFGKNRSRMEEIAEQLKDCCE